MSTMLPSFCEFTTNYTDPIRYLCFVQPQHHQLTFPQTTWSPRGATPATPGTCHPTVFKPTQRHSFTKGFGSSTTSIVQPWWCDINGMNMKVHEYAWENHNATTWPLKLDGQDIKVRLVKQLFVSVQQSILLPVFVSKWTTLLAP